MSLHLLASMQDNRRDEARLRVLRYLEQYPDASTRQIAWAIGVSNGQAYYVVKALLKVGFVKAVNLSNSERKSRYLYLLTRAGILEKLTLTERFLAIKREEYQMMKHEIEALSKDLECADLVVQQRR